MRKRYSPICMATCRVRQKCPNPQNNLRVTKCEKSLSGLGSSNYSDGGTTARVFSTLLTWMNDKTAPVFVVATCNNINALPPELLRKGRFDEIFWLDLPTFSERKEIFRIHLKKRNRKLTETQLEILSRDTDSFSGAEIEQIVINGILNSFYEGKREIVLEDFRREIEVSVPLYRTMKEQIEAFRTWIKGKARPASKPEEKKEKTLNDFE